MKTSEYGVNRYWLDDNKTVLHRLDGPAVEERGSYNDWFYEAYYFNGRLHRLDGPARRYKSKYSDFTNYEEWAINGKILYDIHSQQEFEQYLRLKAFW